MPQDFSGQNLRGRSFKRQNLEGANFSGADIRGANFTGANLRGANFSHAKAGLQSYWAIVFIIILWLFSVLLGFFSGSFGYLAERMLESDLRNQDAIYTSVVSGVLALIVFASVFVATIFRGIGAGFRYANDFLQSN